MYTTTKNLNKISWALNFPFGFHTKKGKINKRNSTIFYHLYIINSILYYTNDSQTYLIKCIFRIYTKYI